MACSTMGRVGHLPSVADRAPQTACVIVTAGISQSWGPAAAAEAGAAGYLLKQPKNFALAEVIANAANRT